MTTENDQATDATDNTNADGANDQTQQDGNEEKTQESSTLLTDGKTEPADTDKSEGGKAEDGKAKEGDKKEGDKKESSSPESYAEFTVPEGISLNQDMLGKFSALAKETNLTQESAQKLVDLAVEHTNQLAQSQQEAFMDLRENWVNEIKADKEFGGAKFKDTLEQANRALKRFGSSELIKFLNQGWGDNPELVKAFARIDRATSEDKVEDGTPPKQTANSAAEVLYGGN